MDELQHLVTSLVVALASSWVTVRLSLRRFRTERIWEKKVSAYERIIDAFHHSLRFSEEHLRAAYKGHDVDDDRDIELRNRSKEAHDEISRATNVGGLILSERALAILEKYKSESDNQPNYDTWWEYLEGDSAIVAKYMKEFLEEARMDLTK